MGAVSDDCDTVVDHLVFGIAIGLCLGLCVVEVGVPISFGWSLRWFSILLVRRGYHECSAMAYFVTALSLWQRQRAPLAEQVAIDYEEAGLSMVVAIVRAVWRSQDRLCCLLTACSPLADPDPGPILIQGLPGSKSASMALLFLALVQPLLSP